MNPTILRKATSNLYLFYRAFVANNFEENVHAPHIEKIARKLTEITYGKNTKNRLCVSVPPQHSKSSLITIAYTVWLILQNPNRKILVINAESNLSETFGIQIRDLIGRLNGLNGITISNVKSSSTYIMFNKNGKLQQGHIRLVGSNGSITGHPEDIIIIDDPYKGTDDITPSLLEKKITWFTTIVEQRVRPNTKVIILHTRWHPLKWDTPILTTAGWKNHGDLKVGDYVYRPNGEPTKVVKIHPQVLVDNCFEFSNGDKLISGNHHLWNVYDWGNRKQRLMETHEIMERQTLVGKKQRSNFLVNNPEPIQYPEQEVPIDPYWLGLWLGDGHKKRPSITCEDKDIISTQSTDYKVIRYDKKVGNCLEAFYTHQGLLNKLRDLGVYDNKHIPNCYLYNSFEVRMQLLAGLIDSDGSVEKSSNKVVFVNTNKTLLKQVYELLTSLSFNVHVEKRPSEVTNKWKKNSDSLPIVSYNDAYALRFTPHLPIPTKIPRKSIKGGGVANRIGLINKYKVEPDWGNCITVEAEDGMYLVGKNLTPTHNSNDLIGYLEREEPDKYDFMSFPAIGPDNKVLWEQYYDYDFYLDKQRTLGERMFQALYQQKPLDLTSDFFYTEHIIWDEHRTSMVPIATCRSWDMAYTEANNPHSKTADYTAGVQCYKYHPNHYLFTDFIHGQFGKDNIHQIQNTAYLDGLNTPILIETGTKGAAAKELYNVWANDYLAKYNTHQSEPWGTKSDRAQLLADMMYDGKIHFLIHNDTLRKTVLDQFKAFPNGQHDDIIDACSYAIHYLKDKGAGHIVTAGKRRSADRKIRRRRR